jgi:8-oxo-dGTP pyrophosphatase MutT (NUDIX family)
MQIAEQLGALLLPPDLANDDDEVSLTEGVQVTYRAAREWISGQLPLPSSDVITWQRAAFMWRTSPAQTTDLLRRIELVESGLAVVRQRVLPVAAAIVTAGTKVLIGRRNDGTPPWGFISGEVEPDERPDDAAVREVKEETGLEVTVVGEIGRRVHPQTDRMMVYIAAKPSEGTEIFVGDEAELAEVRWVSLAEADELLPGMYGPVREHLAREIGQ